MPNSWKAEIEPSATAVVMVGNCKVAAIAIAKYGFVFGRSEQQKQSNEKWQESKYATRNHINDQIRIRLVRNDIQCH